MKEFLKSFLAFGLATSLQKLVGFIILPIYTKVFNPTEYGILEMTNSIMSVAIIFGALQLETSLQRYYYDYKYLRKKILISNVYGWIFIASILVSIILIIFSNYISIEILETDQYAILIFLIALQLPFNNISMLGMVLLRFEKLNNKFLIVVICGVTTSVLLAYLLVVYYNLGLPGVFYAQLGSSIVSCLVVTYFIKDVLLFRFSTIISKKVINYAYPQFPARIGSMFLAQSNRFFMLGFLSLSAIGIYSISVKLASSIQLINTAFIMAWAPFMNAQFNKKNNKIVFANIFPLVVGIVCLFVCIITLFSSEIVQFISTEEYYESYKYMGGLSLFFALYIIKEVIDIGPKIQKKTKYLSLTFFISVIVNIVSLLILVQIFALKGVVIAMIITNLILVIVSWIISNKLYYIDFSVLKFIILFIPALTLTLIVLFFEINYINRIVLFCISLLYYVFQFMFDYKKLRKIL